MAKFKYLVLVTLLLIFCSSLWAKKVDMESAERVVRNLVESKKHKLRDRSKIQLQHTSFKEHKRGQLRQQSTSSDADDVCYYVFNVKDDEYNGFVIVSGDDVAMPVLGYSDSGNYDENNLAPGFVYWMNCLQQEIAYAIENNLPQTIDIKMA